MTRQAPGRAMTAPQFRQVRRRAWAPVTVVDNRVEAGAEAGRAARPASATASAGRRIRMHPDAGRSGFLLSTSSRAPEPG